MLEEKVNKALEEIRPILQADGGDMELIGIDGGTVKLRLTGACKGCPMSQMTLKMHVETILKEKVPEIKAVESVD